MADLKSLKRKTTSPKKKVNSKMSGVDLDKGSEIMSPFSNTERIEKYKDMNFKVSSEFHKRFKKYAIMNDMSMKDLLETAFVYYAEHNNQ